jgi:D-3-phosphoglycerate dehydrogenase|eukprot:COSAG02_NODE_13008_length_1461_cov_1.520558_2_plen_82_part_00
MHVPLDSVTQAMASREFFSRMKCTAIFINTCRGGVQDEAELLAALTQGEIAGAGLDVLEEEPPSPDNPLLNMDNVVVTPHW